MQSRRGGGGVPLLI